MRIATVAALGTVGFLAWSSHSHAVEWFKDPDRGCGLPDNWKKSGRIADLPGCEGALPNGAPPGEIAMHDAKLQLHEAESAIAAGDASELESKIAQAAAILDKASSDPRLNWAREYYRLAEKILHSKAALLPWSAKLQDARKAVRDLAATTPPPDAATLAAAAKACSDAFTEAEAAGVNLSLPHELVPGRFRALRDDMQECDPAKAASSDSAPQPAAQVPAAGGEAAAQTEGKPRTSGSDGGVPRRKWEERLKGDRKRVFMEHEYGFPEFEGEPGPKGAAKATEWKYGSELFRFKGNKLLPPE